MRARLPFRLKFVFSLFVGLVPAVAAFLYSGAARRLESGAVRPLAASAKPVIDPVGAVVTVVAYAKDPAEESLRILPPEFGYQSDAGVEVSAEALEETTAASLDLSDGSVPLAGGSPRDLSLGVFSAEWAQVAKDRQPLPVPRGVSFNGANLPVPLLGAGYRAPETAVVARLASEPAGAATGSVAGAMAYAAATVAGDGRASVGVGSPALRLAAPAGAAPLYGAGSTPLASAGVSRSRSLALQAAMGAAAALPELAAGPAVPAPTSVSAAAAAATGGEARAAAAMVEPGSRGLSVLTDLIRGQAPLPVLSPRDWLDLATLQAGLPVPEPGTLPVLLVGMVAVAGSLTRRRR